MTTRNLLLCRLLGSDSVCLPPAGAFDDAAAREDAVLVAMCLARAGEVLRFETMLPTIDEDGIALLSRYCLMLMLATDAKVPSLLFDALRQSRPGIASLWRDLALAEAAWGFPAQALRSIALANALSGEGAPIGPIPNPAVERRRSASNFNFLPGNEKRFFPI